MKTLFLFILIVGSNYILGQSAPTIPGYTLSSTTTNQIFINGELFEYNEYDYTAIGSAIPSRHFCAWSIDPSKAIECTGGQCEVQTINGGGQCIVCIGGEFDGGVLCGPDERGPDID